MATEQAYRSSHPSVIAGLEEADRENERFADDLDALKTDLGLEGWDAMYVRGSGGQNHFIGFRVEWRREGGKRVLVREPPAEGWRIEYPKRGDDLLVPHKGTKIGKAFAARIAQVQPFKDVSACLPGMPRRWFVSEDRRDYGYGLFVHDGTVYVEWGTTLVDEGVDHGIWESIPRSVFYAAREAFDADHEVEATV